MKTYDNENLIIENYGSVLYDICAHSWIFYDTDKTATIIYNGGNYNYTHR